MFTIGTVSEPQCTQTIILMMAPKVKSETGNNKPKTFNKAEWRKKKYNHKAKVEKFEENRRKSALHKYYKELKKSQPSTSISGEAHGSTGSDLTCQKSRKFNPYEKAKLELERRKQEKEQLRMEKERQKLERKEALQKYKKDKVRKYIKLKQKTKKGQPVMAGRMELLLERIQKSVT